MLTPEQITERRNSIGASDSASVMGLSPWKSALQLWLEKTGAVEPEDLSDNESVEWGQRLELLVGAKFAQTHPELHVEVKQLSYEHSKYQFMTCTLDGIVEDAEGYGFPLEIKTASAWKEKEWLAGVPTYYLVQVQHQLAVTGAEKAWVACLIGGQKYVEYLVLRDEEMIQQIVAKCVAFWQGVEQCIPPEADGSESSDRAIKTLYPSSEEGKEIELPEQIGNAIDLKIVYEKSVDEYEAICRALSNKIKQAMGDAEVGRVGKWIVSYKANKAGHKVLRFKEVEE